MELLRQATNTCADVKNKTNCNPLPIVGIPYRGGGPLMNAILANEIPMIFINQDAALPYVTSGKLRPIAVTTAKRIAAAPDVPTVAEAGVPGFEAIGWNGIVAPAKTPPAIIARLNSVINAVVQEPEMMNTLGHQGVELDVKTPAELGAMIHSEIVKWDKLVKQADVKAD